MEYHMHTQIKFLITSKKGLARDKNQDRILVFEKEKFYFFALFDGVSSYDKSYELIKEFKKKLKSKINSIDFIGNNIEVLLYEINKETSNINIPGASTISVLFISKETNKAKYISVGDTRIYIFNNQFIEQLTIDDTLEIGSNIITKYLGDCELTLDDFKSYQIDNNYNYLICTDGFYKLMEDNLKEYFMAFNFKHIKNTKKKISYLQENENRDDSSYIIIKNEISVRN
jgi:serine/threonine protein phosphatase PrpC